VERKGKPRSSCTSAQMERERRVEGREEVCGKRAREEG
jgi:hypothetical protein